MTVTVIISVKTKTYFFVIILLLIKLILFKEIKTESRNSLKLVTEKTKCMWSLNDLHHDYHTSVANRDG